MKKQGFLSFLVWLTAQVSWAQQTDRVLQVLNLQNQPLVGVAVNFKEINSPDSFQITQYTDLNGSIVLLSDKSFNVSFIEDIGKVDNFIWLPYETQKVVKVNTLYNQINAVSITTGQPKSALQNPYTVEVISSKTIQQMGAQNLSDVLQNSSNIQLNQDAVLGSSLQLQGLGGQNIKILINGVPMVGRLNGNIDISQIPMSTVERIEIIEGPMSVIYGSDAIGGVINIITKKPVRRSNSYHGSYFTDGIGNTNFDGGVQLGSLSSKSRLTMSADFGRQFFAGKDFDLSTRSFDWKPKTKLFATGTLGYSFARSKHQFQANFFQEKLTDRSNAEYNLITVIGYNNYFNTRRIDGSLNSDFQVGKRGKIQLINSYNIYQRTKTMVRRDLVEGYEIITRPEDQDTTLNTAINARGIYSNFSKNHRWEWLTGYEFNHEILTTQRVKQNNGIYDAALYGSVEYNPTLRLQIKPSVRAIYNNQFGTNPFPGITGNSFKLAPIIPSIQIKYNISKHLVFRSSYAKGFRAPSIKELYFFFVDINHNVQGNPALKPELAHNFITSIDYRHEINKYAGATFKISTFANNIQNQIQLGLIDLQTNLYKYINVGLMQSYGLTGQMEITWKALRTKFGSSYTANNSQLNEGSGWNKWALWQHTANMSYEFHHGLTLQWFSRYTGSNTGFLENGDIFKQQGYFLSDVSATKSLLKKRLEFQLGCKNLFNVTRVASNGSMNTGGAFHSGGSSGLNIAPGRTVFINCKVNL